MHCIFPATLFAVRRSGRLLADMVSRLISIPYSPIFKSPSSDLDGDPRQTAEWRHVGRVSVLTHVAFLPTCSRAEGRANRTAANRILQEAL